MWIEFSLNIDTAIPVGLLVNELVSNSLKYAFPGNRPKIHVDFRTAPTTSNCWRVAMMALGCRGDFDLDKVSTRSSFGQDFDESVGWRADFRRNGGTEFEITFKAQRERERR